MKSYAYTARQEVVKVLSKHTLKGGFKFRKLMLNFTQYGATSGQFAFGNGPTVRVVNQNTPTTEGFGFASFLLGLPNNNGGALITASRSPWPARTMASFSSTTIRSAAN